MVPPAGVVWVRAARRERLTPGERRDPDRPTGKLPIREAAALALLSASLTAVIFLVVLLLVSGWSIEPLAAALAVSVLPVAALISSRLPGSPQTRAVAGCLLVAGGGGCLAPLPPAPAPGPRPVPPRGGGGRAPGPPPRGPGGGGGGARGGGGGGGGAGRARLPGGGCPPPPPATTSPACSRSATPASRSPLRRSHR